MSKIKSGRTIQNNEQAGVTSSIQPATGQPAAPGEAPGTVSADDVAKLKAKHGKLLRVRVTVAADDEAVLYLKPADRNVTALFMSKRNQSKVLEAGEAILDNCFVAGDERFRTNDAVRTAAAMQAINCIDFLEATTEEV